MKKRAGPRPPPPASGAGRHPQARQEPGDEDRQHPVADDEPLHPLDAPGGGRDEAAEDALPVAPAQPVAHVVAGHRAHDRHDHDDGEAELPLPGEIATDSEDGLLGNGEPHVTEDHDQEDRPIAPRIDQPAQVRHGATGRRIARGYECWPGPTFAVPSAIALLKRAAARAGTRIGVVWKRW